MPFAFWARAEVPLFRFVLLGAQTSFLHWQADSDETFGSVGHYTVDVSALLRCGWGSAGTASTSL